MVLNVMTKVNTPTRRVRCSDSSSGAGMSGFIESPANSAHRSGGVVERVLPNAHNLPALFSELARVALVSSNVAPDLCLPILNVRLGQACAPFASVPKATVYEHRHALGSKDEVRVSPDRLVAPPSCDPRLPESVDHPLFGGLIAAALNARHRV